MKKKLLFLTATLTVPFLFACGLDEVEVKPTESITLNKTEVILNIGEEDTLKATALPKEASQEFVWKSSAPNAVNVIGGKITAYALPEVVYTEEEKTHYYDEEKHEYYVAITASNYTKDVKDLKVATCKVFVTNNSSIEDVPAESISISNSRLDFVVGDSAADLFATVLPTNSKYKNVDWSFVDDDADNEVISITNKIQPNPDSDVYSERVSSKATITPLKEGNATITVKNVVENEGDLVFSATCAVSVTKPEEEVVVSSMSFAADEIGIQQGKSGTNQLNLYPFNAKDKEVTYSSNNIKVSVDQSGMVTVAADATIGDEATITATLVSNPSITASYKVTVEEHHVNYMFIKRNSVNKWVAEEMSLKLGSETEYCLNDIHLLTGEEFVFCTQEETWHHYAQIKDGEGSAKGDFASGDDGNIVVGRSGTYDIYIESDLTKCEEFDGDFKSIWIENEDYDPVTVSMTAYIGGEAQTPIDLSLKAGSETEFELPLQLLNEGDEVIFNLSGAELGYAQLKDNITAPVEEGSHNRIRAKNSLIYNFYVESGAVTGNKRIWVNANYMVIGRVNGEGMDWSFDDITLKPGSETEYCALDVELGVGDRVVFNVGNGWYHFENCKRLEDNPVWANIERDNDSNIVFNVAGKYDFYIETVNGPKDGDNDRGCIWIAQTPVYVSSSLLVKDGDPIALSPKSETEYEVLDITIEAGTEFVAKIGDGVYGYDKLKIGSASSNYDEGSVYSSEIHYLVAKNDLKVSIFVSTVPDENGDNIWIHADYIQIYRKSTGKWTYQNIGINPDEGKETEFKVTGVALSAGDKVLFCLNNEYYHFANLKTDSRIYPKLSSDDYGNIVISVACNYDFYIETKDGPKDGENDRQTIWVACEVESNPNYILSVGSTSTYNWYLNDGATLYAYAFNGNGEHKWIKGTVEGEATNKVVVFAIPGKYDKAAFVRIHGTITNVDEWAGVEADGIERWDRTIDGQDIALCGHTGGVNFDLVSWNNAYGG